MPDMLELVWLDPHRTASIRARAPWQRLLDEARRAAPDGAPTEPLLPADAPPDDRRDVFLVLARGEATGADGIAAALAGAVHADGKFAPPLLIVEGTLRFPFDELEALKAGVTTATPFAGGDDPLRAALDGARSYLAAPGLVPAPVVTETLLGRLREAFGRVRRAVPPGYLDAQIDRALVEHRRYQARVFAGTPHLRALLDPEGQGEKAPVLVYLPAAAAPKLPLFQRFPARLVVAGHLSTDQFEPYPFALEALALARRIPR